MPLHRERFPDFDVILRFDRVLKLVALMGSPAWNQGDLSEIAIL